jgi:hypothetical protein
MKTMEKDINEHLRRALTAFGNNDQLAAKEAVKSAKACSDDILDTIDEIILKLKR